MRCFVSGIRCRFGEDFLSISTIRAKIKLLSNFCQNTPCQIKAIAQFNAMPKSMQCQINAMPNQCNECEAALSNPLYGVRRERIDPVRR
jgi:hypothetical protein